MKKEILVVLTVAVLVLSACAAKSIYTSNPMKQNQENDAYGLTFEPIKQGHDFFAAFKITVKNKTDKELKIDWNKSLYLYAGKPDGVFVFRGIDPSKLKNRTVPPDIVPPHGTFTKEIVPASTVAWTPLRDTSPSDESRINAGILPNGQNGILLSVSLQGREISQQATVDIIEQKIK